jgi:hypothetical protein
LIGDTAAHLNSELNTGEEFVGFDVFGSAMGINQFQ